ncbi:MAG TPA: ABC transporter substrate-binding protein [Stellaceae bacterium]|nr:ABC transporter substrate-binding protein [Stellaceae bacterium]
MRAGPFLWAAALAVAIGMASPAGAAETPRYGGTLTYMIPADAPPSFDAHREETYATIHTAAPFYSVLVRVNPYDPGSTTDIVCDVCTKVPTPTDGGKTWTFKIRDDVTFHDGDKLTADDVAASFNMIAFPPKGILSPRSANFLMVDKIEATDPHTVVFHLKFATAAFLPAIADPYNWIYQKKVLDKDPHWYEHHILGSGPFKFAGYEAGQWIKGVRNPHYYHKGLPYLDGFVGIYAPKQATQIDAIRADRAATEFRGYPPSAINQLKQELGDKIKVQSSDWNCGAVVWFNHKKKPFDDVRVRRALTLALDRWGSAPGLSKIAVVHTVGSIVFPGSPLAPTKAELEKIPGFWPDIAKSRAEAHRLLKEAGAEGLSFDLLNRNVDQPYKYNGTWLVDQWSKIGLHVTQRVLPTGPWFAALRRGDFGAGLAGNCQGIVNPLLDVHAYLPHSVSASNYGYYEDPVELATYEKMLHSTDPKEQKSLMYQFVKRVMGDQAHIAFVLWWQRIVPLRSYVHGWKIGPSHYLNQDLSTIWLAPPHCGDCTTTASAAPANKHAQAVK